MAAMKGGGGDGYFMSDGCHEASRPVTSAAQVLDMDRTICKVYRSRQLYGIMVAVGRGCRIEGVWEDRC